MNVPKRGAKFSGANRYRLAWLAAACAALLTVWTTVVRDDGSGDGHVMIVMAVAVSGFAAGFRAAGLARAMCGIAAMTCAMGLLMATDSSTPDPERALTWTGVLGLLWLCSAALFRAAARGEASR